MTARTALVEAMMDEMADERGSRPRQPSRCSRGEADRTVLEAEKPMIDVDRFADLEESASVVAFLASDAASYVTGSAYRIDGGAIPSVDV